MSEDTPAFNPKRPYSLHSQEGKISTYDQNGVLYDVITLQPLDHEDEDVKSKWTVTEGAPHSHVITDSEKLQSAIATLKASGSVDADTIAKFESLVRGGEND